MQIEKKQTKQNISKTIIWVLFIPLIRVKTVRIDKNYVKKYCYLFGFFPIFAMELLAPLKESKMTGRFDFSDM